jgi:serine phosphatase RsbU (regulator of sigma subunit)
MLAERNELMPQRWRIGSTRIQNVVVDACWRPAVGEHSGDFHGVIDLRDGRVGVVIGDVAGLGAAAAELAERLHSITRVNLQLGQPLADLLRDLDAETESRGEDMIATFLCALIDPAARSMEIMNAGHLPPIAVDHSGAALLDNVVHPPLGVPSARPPFRHHVAHDGALIVITDGLTERRSSSIEEGLAALARACAAIDPATANAVEVAAYLTGLFGEPDDDATVITDRIDTT